MSRCRRSATTRPRPSSSSRCCACVGLRWPRITPRSRPPATISASASGSSVIPSGRSSSTRRAIDIRERTIGADHPSTAITRNNLADAYLAQGRLDLALPLAEQALAHLQRRVGDAHPYTSYALHTLGEIHLALGNAGAAVEMLERAEEARVAAQVDPIELATTRLVLAKALRAAHRPEAEVRARLTAAIEGFGDGPRTREQVAQAASLLAELGNPSGVR
ncbi:MAG: tetratricopeptide repeat protein [Deltaproteobacteria bacterium]|nr:tetratricopeptide repeat protein [Deltaproteobacteria bacterium]